MNIEHLNGCCSQFVDLTGRQQSVDGRVVDSQARANKPPTQTDDDSYMDDNGGR
jgi:hypothetical protein